VNNELKAVSKETVVAQSGCYLAVCIEGLMETMKNLRTAVFHERFKPSIPHTQVCSVAFTPTCLVFVNITQKNEFAKTDQSND
jgi:hypothetical protein